MNRFAHRLIAALSTAVALLWLTASEAFAVPAPPEVGSFSAVAVEPAAVTTTTATGTAPIVWMVAGAMIVLAILAVYAAAKSIARRNQRTSGQLSAS